MAQNGIESGQFKPLALPGETVSLNGLKGTPLIVEEGKGVYPAYTERRAAKKPHVNVSSVELAQIVGIDGNGAPSRPTLLGTEGAEVIFDVHLTGDPVAEAWGVTHPVIQDLRQIEAQREDVREYEYESADVPDVTDLGDSISDHGLGLVRKGHTKGQLGADVRAREMRDVLGPAKDRKKTEGRKHKAMRSVGSVDVLGRPSRRVLEHRVSSRKERVIEERKHIAEQLGYGEPLSSRVHLPKTVYAVEGQAIGRLKATQKLQEKEIALVDSVRQAAAMPVSERDQVAKAKTVEFGMPKDQDPMRFKAFERAESMPLKKERGMGLELNSKTGEYEWTRFWITTDQDPLLWTPRPDRVSKSEVIQQIANGQEDYREFYRPKDSREKLDELIWAVTEMQLAGWSRDRIKQELRIYKETGNFDIHPDWYFGEIMYDENSGRQVFYRNGEWGYLDEELDGEYNGSDSFDPLVDRLVDDWYEEEKAGPTQDSLIYVTDNIAYAPDADTRRLQVVEILGKVNVEAQDEEARDEEDFPGYATSEPIYVGTSKRKSKKVSLDEMTANQELIALDEEEGVHYYANPNDLRQ